MTMLKFIVLGEPVTKGSTVGFVPRRGDGSYVHRPDGSPLVVVRDDTGRRGECHADGIAKAALKARMASGLGVVRGEAVLVTLRFFTVRPKGHYGSGRNEGLLKDRAPARPAKRPDVDKFVRHVLDAMTGVIYADDGQVVEVLASKEYAEGSSPPRTEVQVVVCSRQTVGVVQVDEQLALVA